MRRTFIANFGFAAAALVLLAAGAAHAEQTVSKTLDAAPDGYVKIYNIAGSIEVIGWDRAAVKVDAVLGDDVEELEFVRDGDEIVIKVKAPRKHRRDISSELEVHVPRESRIAVSGVSADIDVDGVRGEQSLQTVSGDVSTNAANEDVEAESVSGDVTISGTSKDAEIDAATVSGDVTVSGLSGSVDAESVSGDVKIEGGSYDRADLESVNGDLAFHSELRRGGRISMESVNGRAELRFTKPVSARFDIETFNGSIKNCFGPKPQRTSRYSPGLELSFDEGGGEGRVDVETLNGSIYICNE